jgi:hypothetical protein
VGSTTRLVVGFRLVVVTEVAVGVDRVAVVVVVSLVVEVIVGLPGEGTEAPRVVVVELTTDDVVEAVVLAVRFVPPGTVVVDC